ncbi:MAG: lamin tail domain-containing protein [Verrucomicrobiales bacterium]|nr:lamin tail domain-containing protein [Verrucomicrobiales bacterium]
MKILSKGIGIGAVAVVGLMATAGEVFPEASSWKYFKGVSEASAPDSTAWRGADFDDSGWLAGAAPFFYDTAGGYVGNTELADMPGSYAGVFLRRTFSVTNPEGIQLLTLDLRTDDGCAVWLNGREVARVGLPEGELTFQTTALDASGEPKLASVTISNTPGLLNVGDNVLAVQACNASLEGSSDFLFAAALGSVDDDAPPVVIETIPAADSTVNDLTLMEVVFDENVTGVDAADLRINGSPAVAVEMHSPRDYTFSFPEPPEGVVALAWRSDHGITDLAPGRNPFAGGAWTVILDKTVRLSRVIISEFLADNGNGIRDEDADREDWIELLNLGPDPLDLDGWYLTDDGGNLTKWRLPARLLDVNAYLLVWASGKDRAPAAGELHANFKLSSGGEYLALVDPDGRVVSAFGPAFPEQRENISYGRDRLEPDLVGYFPTPTPGSPNVSGGPGFAPDPVFDLASGLYPGTSLEVNLSAPSGEIRYTVNGQFPTAAATLYEGPIPITSGTVVMARVFQDGLLPGRVVARGYELVDPGLVGFDSNLPLLIIQPSRTGIPQDSRIVAHVTAIEPFRGRAALLGKPAHQGLAQIEIRGQSSTGFPKKQYNLELTDDAGLDLEVSLLGLPAESDWVLNGPYTDKSLLNNFLAYELHEQMGHYAVRRRFVEVFIDESRGQLRYPTDYRGIYVLLEKIKIDNQRLDLERLGPTTSEEPGISGGYIFKKDKDSPGDRSFTSNGGAGFSRQTLKYHDPKPDEITLPQQRWLRDYVNAFESALYAADWKTRAGADHYSAYIDVDSFVDNHWIVEFAKQIDGYRLSNYLHKERGGRINMDPIWDWNLSFGNADYLNGWIASGWYYSLISENQHIWLRRLISGTTGANGTTGDPDFNQAIADRWSVLRTNVLSGPRVTARVDAIAAYLDEAKDRDFSRWPRLNTYVWPNPRIYIVPTYAQIIANKKQWIADRFAWIDSQFLPVPQLSRPGGPVPHGFPVSVTAPTGNIYYTLDGSDPRRSGGGISAQARMYQGSVPVDQNRRLVARALQGNRWSGPTAATFVVDSLPLRITEIMYHPAPPPPGNTNDVSNFEFIELLNTGTTPVALAGYRFVAGIQFDFSTGTVTSLAPGARVLVVRNRASFEERYGANAAVTGEFTGSLDNAGERLRLVGPMQEEVQDFAFNDRWYPATDGLGFALTPVNPLADQAALDSSAGWSAGRVPGGTPGGPEPVVAPLPVVVVNEVLTHTDAPQVDAIELFNPAAGAVDVSGWFLSDDFRAPKYRLPAGSVIPSQGFLVVDETDFNPGLGGTNEFNLRSSGDEVYLYSADASGALTGYVQGFEFGAALNGVSFGRYATTDGAGHFVAQSQTTLGGPNAGPRVGPVVISEVMYHPPDVPANGALWDAPEDEYIELLNLTDAIVPLYDPNADTNTWRLRDAVDFTFPMGQHLSARERVLVVRFDPVTDAASASAFRAKYRVPVGVRMFGPWDGKLDNGGEPIELIQPDQVRFYTNAPVTTAVLVDRVRYRDDPPWPSGADGVGFALQRVDESAYGDESSNWIAAAPTPGTGAPLPEAPRILAGPTDVVTQAAENVALQVVAEGSGPLNFQWRLDGSNLPGATAATLLLPAIQQAQAGRYQVVVFNAGGATSSGLAQVTVIAPGLDSDADGMDDLYEVTYRLDPLDPNDVGLDPDGDGVRNDAECVAGTDPRDPDSYLRFEGIDTTGPTRIEFAAAANRAYGVYYRDDLHTGGWLLLERIPVLSAGSLARRTVTVVDPASPAPPRRFYHLQARVR